jgi:hypothetical protein
LLEDEQTSKHGGGGRYNAILEFKGEKIKIFVKEKKRKKKERKRKKKVSVKKKMRKEKILVCII